MLTEQQQQIPEQPPVMSAADILSSLAPQAAEAAPEGGDAAPQLVGGVPVDQFLGAAKEVFGDVDSIDALKGRFQEAGRLPELQAELARLQAQVAVDPFHSPLSRTFDQKLKEGLTGEALRSFVELSLLNVDELSPVDAIRRHYTLSKPGFTPDEINALIQRDLGFDPSETDELSAMQTAQLKEKRGEAVAFLKQQQVPTENPEAVAAARQRQELVDRNMNVWKDVLPQLTPNTKMQFSIGEDAFEFAYQPSKEALDAARGMLQAAIQANPLAFEPNKGTAEKLQADMRAFLILADYENFSKALFNHAFSLATQQQAQRYSGNAAVIDRAVGQQQKTPGTQMSQQDVLNAINW